MEKCHIEDNGWMWKNSNLAFNEKDIITDEGSSASYDTPDDEFNDAIFLWSLMSEANWSWPFIQLLNV